jgi:TRAP-type C4-dicarboxylate transport system permease small subunit
MDPELKKMLEETLTLTQENNKILQDVKRSMLWARIMNIIYWVLIIGISIGAFYFLQPYIDQIVKTYGGFSDAFKNFQQ